VSVVDDLVSVPIDVSVVNETMLPPLSLRSQHSPDVLGVIVEGCLASLFGAPSPVGFEFENVRLGHMRFVHQRPDGTCVVQLPVNFPISDRQALNMERDEALAGRISVDFLFAKCVLTANVGALWTVSDDLRELNIPMIEGLAPYAAEGLVRVSQLDREQIRLQKRIGDESARSGKARIEGVVRGMLYKEAIIAHRSCFDLHRSTFLPFSHFLNFISSPSGFSHTLSTHPVPGLAVSSALLSGSRISRRHLTSLKSNTLPHRMSTRARP
jgi:hypothetical protein